MKAVLILLPVSMLLTLVTGCASLMVAKNPVLAKSTVEVRGDTAVHRGHYRTGGIRSEVILVQGRREGPVRLFFADSALESEFRYRDGKAVGEAARNFPSGRRQRVEFYVDDTLQVERTVEFDSTGSRISEWRPAGDAGTGAYLLRRDGQVTDSTYYVGGKPEGFSFVLGPGGDTVSRTFYRNGKQDSLRSWRKPGPAQRSTESILKVIRKNTPSLRHTYNAYLASSRFGGKVTLRFGIRRDGHIVYVLPIGNSTGKPRFARDIVNHVQNWKFAAVEQTALDIVTVPFTFSE